MVGADMDSDKTNNFDPWEEDEVDKNKRFDIFFERHFGFGIRWGQLAYKLDLSIAFPFVTITFGIGKEL